MTTTWLAVAEADALRQHLAELCPDADVSLPETHSDDRWHYYDWPEKLLAGHPWMESWSWHITYFRPDGPTSAAPPWLIEVIRLKPGNTPPPEAIPAAIRGEILKPQRCFYCGTTQGIFEMEHVLPKSRGGTNERANLVCSCKGCNRQKGTMTPFEWRQWRTTNGMVWPPEDLSVTCMMCAGPNPDRHSGLFCEECGF